MKRQGGFRVKPGQTLTKDASNAASATATAKPLQKGTYRSAGVYRDANGLYNSKDGYRSGTGNRVGPLPGAQNTPRPRGNTALQMANQAAQNGQGMASGQGYRQLQPGQNANGSAFQGNQQAVGGIVGQQGGTPNNWEQVRPGSGPMPQYHNMAQAQQGGDRLGAYTNWAQGQMGGIVPQGQAFQGNQQAIGGISPVQQAAHSAFQQNQNYIPGGDPRPGQNPMVNQILNMSPQQVQGMMTQQNGNYQNPQAPMYRPQYVPYRG